MNIPRSAIEPFGVTGIPKFHLRRDEKIRQLVAYARLMYDNITLPITPVEIDMMTVILIGRHGAYDVSITWEKEEFERGYHRLGFRIDGEPGYITAYLHPTLSKT